MVFLVVLCVAIALFSVNVLAIAFHGPWWTQPFQLLIALGNHGTTFFRWLATHIAEFFIWIASWFKEVLERLGPAVTQSFQDGWNAVWGGMPTWFITFWTVFCETIAAGYDMVKPWITWIVVFVVGCVILFLVYKTLFVWTSKGHDWSGKCYQWLESIYLSARPQDGDMTAQQSLQQAAANDAMDMTTILRPSSTRRGGQRGAPM